MKDAESLGPAVLQALRIRLLATFPAQIRACVERLDEDQLWWRPNEESNSVANLVLHLSGSILEFVGKRIGGFAYHRDRPLEFSERQPIPKAQLIARFDHALETADKSLDQLAPERLTEPSIDPERSRLLLDDLVNATVHMAAHAAQIAYITKMLRGSSLDDLWMKAHRETKAWKA